MTKDTPLPIVERLRGPFPHKVVDMGIEVDDFDTAEAWMEEAATIIQAQHEALEIAQKELAELIEFHDSPKKPCGEYGSECPISMGEWFDRATRERIGKIDTVLALARGEKE